MGELQSHPTAKEDRMFELLKSANLAYDRKMNYLRLVQEREGLKQLMGSSRLWEQGLRQRLFEVIYSSEENEDF